MDKNLDIAVNYKNEIEDFFFTRSKFYNIEPIGIGTPYVESLSSYISRLAAIHNVKLIDLLKLEVSPLLLKDYLKKELSNGITKGSMIINENSIVTLDYISALELLIKRNDLTNLTLLNWSGIFKHNIVSKHRRWCPICLLNMESESGSENIYEPLIWYISSIDICDIHKIILKDKCPNCNKSLPFLHSRFRVGHCQYCEFFLGEDLDYCEVELSKWDEFVILNYKLLIENTNIKKCPTKLSFIKNLKKIMKELGFVNIASFARFLEYLPKRITDLFLIESLPSEKVIIDIAYKLNLSIYELLCNDDVKCDINVQIDKRIKRKDTNICDIEYYLKEGMNSENPKSLFALAKEWGFSDQTAKKHLPLLCSQYEAKYLLDKENKRSQKQREIENILKECLDKLIPISLTQCAKENGLTYKILSKNSPELSRKVCRRYKNYLKERKNKRINSILMNVRKVAIEMHNKGIFPSKERLANRLGRGIFLEKEIRDGWLDIMNELNLIVNKEE